MLLRKIRFSSLLILILLATGCFAGSEANKSSSADLPNENAASANPDEKMKITAVPRPNSGTFTTEQATKLLPEFLRRSKPISASDELVTNWKSPTQGIRIHVTSDEAVEIIDYFGSKSTGIDNIQKALDSTMTRGNERSVLLTSDRAGWETPLKRKVVDSLFQPSVQIYITED